MSASGQSARRTARPRSAVSFLDRIGSILFIFGKHGDSVLLFDSGMMMDSMLQRFSAVLLATAMAAGPVLAQVTPGDPAAGPAGDVPSTTGPSNAQGTPPGSADAAAPRHHRHRHHHRARHRRHHTARPAATDTNSGAGLNGSDAPSH